MKVVFYDELNQVANVVENVINPVIDNNNIQWEDGAITGANLPFLLIDDTIDISSLKLITDEFKQNDKKELYSKTDPNEELKRQLESISKDFQDFMDFFFNQ